MGLWSRIQVNGALQRLGKRVAANPHLWAFAPDGRPHFDHWVEHATDDELVGAAAELVAFTSQIPQRYHGREWGQQLIAIIQGSIECARREMSRRGLSTHDEEEIPSTDAEQEVPSSSLEELQTRCTARARSEIEKAVTEHSGSLGDAMLLACLSSATGANVLYKYQIASSDELEGFVRSHLATLIGTLTNLRRSHGGRTLLPVDQADFAEFHDLLSPYVGEFINKPEEIGGPSKVVGRFFREHQQLLSDRTRFTMETAHLLISLTTVCGDVLSMALAHARAVASSR